MARVRRLFPNIMQSSAVVLLCDFNLSSPAVARLNLPGFRVGCIDRQCVDGWEGWRREAARRAGKTPTAQHLILAKPTSWCLPDVEGREVSRRAAASLSSAPVWPAGVREIITSWASAAESTRILKRAVFIGFNGCLIVDRHPADRLLEPHNPECLFKINHLMFSFAIKLLREDKRHSARTQI